MGRACPRPRRRSRHPLVGRDVGGDSLAVEGRSQRRDGEPVVPHHVVHRDREAVRSSRSAVVWAGPLAPVTRATRRPVRARHQMTAPAFGEIASPQYGEPSVATVVRRPRRSRRVSPTDPRAASTGLGSRQIESAASSGVSVGPGATAFTRMPVCATYTTSDLISPRTAPFAAT